LQNFEIMKKIIYLFALLFIGANYTSCTPENILDQVNEQACCDDESTIPPPPPPPPGEDEVGS
jgi:hypothetical protein